MEMDAFEDAYSALGFSGDDLAALSSADIRKAYRAQALRLHPDKNVGDAGAAARFAAIFAAYETLCDPARRQEIDGHRAARVRRRTERDQLDTRRRRLRDELVARERAAATPYESSKDADMRASSGVTSHALDPQALARMQEEIRRLREENLAPKWASATRAPSERASHKSAWARVPGFADFVAARTPFEEFERAVLDASVPK